MSRAGQTLNQKNGQDHDRSGDAVCRWMARQHRIHAPLPVPCASPGVPRILSRATALLFLSLAAVAIGGGGCVNPFAPGRDDTPAVSACDPHTIEGIFQCFQAAYTFRDTTIYGQLLDGQFIFVYRNYDVGIDVTWGRDEEMRSTFGLFQNAQKLDLIWNNVVSTSAESTRVNVVRGFNLTIVFNPSDIERVDGYANLTFERTRISDPWRIIRWRDESNF